MVQKCFYCWKAAKNNFKFSFRFMNCHRTIQIMEHQKILNLWKRQAILNLWQQNGTVPMITL